MKTHSEQIMLPMSFSRFLAIAVLLIGFSTFANAQSTQLRPGQVQLSMGLGLVSSFAADQTQTITPPLSLRADVMLGEHFSLGAYAAYSAYKGESIFLHTGLMEQYDTRQMMLGLRATAISSNLNNWHVYGGFLLGTAIADVNKNVIILDPDMSKDDDLPSFTRPNEPTALLFSGYVGAQRAISPKMHAFGEVGYGISLVNIGLGWKF